MNASDREKAIDAARAAHAGNDCAEFAVDALIALGWGPGGARPTREGLAEVLGAHQIVARGLTINTPDECSCGAGVGYEAGEDVSVRRARAFAQHQRDALLAADHLWTTPAGGVEYGEGLLVDDSPDRYVLHRGPWVEPRALDEGYVLMQRTVGPWVPSGSVPTETEGSKE